MVEFTEVDLQEAHRALFSTLRKCENSNAEKLPQAQRTLLERRIAALNIALALIEKELEVTSSQRARL